MRRFASIIRDLFGQQSPSRSASRQTRRPFRRRPELEPLEDRSLLSANASGTLSGVAFIDGNNNGVLDAQEATLPGVSVELTGTTNTGTAIKVDTFTAAKGSFTFQNILPGTYQVSAGPVPGLLGPSASFTNLKASPGVDIVGSLPVSGGSSLTQNLGFQGLSSSGVSLRQFLSSTTNTAFPFAPAGSGTALVTFRPNNLPTVANPIADGSVPVNSAPKQFNLSSVFSDPDITDSTVQFDVSVNGVTQTITVQLFDKEAPQTVANFLNYVTSGAYNNSIFHRLVTPSSGGLSVLQGGGFTFSPNPKVTLPAIPTIQPPVQNEFGMSNTTGTLAMALNGSDINSATDEFFFNVADNSAALDPQKFAVFGKVATPADQGVLNALFTTSTVSHQASPFDNIPLNGYNGTNFPTDTTASNYLLIKNITVVNQDEFLHYSIVSNSNPNVVTPSINYDRLTLAYPQNATGSSTIVVRATDRFGATVDTSFTVKVG
jgi:cyclophilin family peptidyl-prolyl cis-trans isomerase